MGKKQKNDESSEDSYQDINWGANKNTYYLDGDKDYSDEEQEREEVERTVLQKNLKMDEDAYGDFASEYSDEISSENSDENQDGDKSSENLSSKSEEDQTFEKKNLKKDNYQDSIIKILQKKQKKMENLYYPLKEMSNNEKSAFNDTERKFIESLFLVNSSYILSLLYYVSMRTEGTSTKSHPVLKKLIAKKELVDFYDKIENDYKTPLKSLAKNYFEANFRDNRELSENLDNLGTADGLEEQVQKIKNQVKKLGKNKNGNKKLLEKGSNRLSVVEETNLLNLEVCDNDFEDLEDIIDEQEELRLNNDEDFPNEDPENPNADIGYNDGFSDDSDNIDFEKIEKKLKNNQIPEDLTKKPIVKDKMGAEMYYNSQKFVKDDKRAILKEKIREELEQRKKKELGKEFKMDLIGEDEARVISRKMQINKGFTRKRKKEDYNPRVKRRRKFERATYKRITMGHAKTRPQPSVYDGEFHGIKGGINRAREVN